MKKNRANILIYAIFLANFAIVIAWLLFSKSEVLSQNIQYQNLNTRAVKNVKEKWVLALRYDRSVNSDGGGFVDTVSCPDIVYNGQPVPEHTVAKLEEWKTVCASGSFTLYYNAGFTGFSQGKYGTDIASVSGTNPFTISFSGGMSLTGSFSATPSGIDSNMNSDDYTAYSTGTTRYPNGYLDNDILGRTTIYGYAKRGVDWYNVFWNNTQINHYIAANKNNASSGITVPLGEVTAWYIRFDVDGPWKFKILEFDSGAYQETKTLKKLHEETFDFPYGAIGWFGKNGSVYPWTAVANSGSLREFDFKNKNYALFIYFPGSTTDPDMDFLKYKITAETTSGSGVYLTPIDDSAPDTIKYLGGDILIGSGAIDGYVSKQFEIIEPKTIGG